MVCDVYVVCDVYIVWCVCGVFVVCDGCVVICGGVMCCVLCVLQYSVVVAWLWCDCSGYSVVTVLNTFYKHTILKILTNLKP